MTIEERAEEYSKDNWGMGYSKNLEILRSKEGYIRGATEQNNVSLEAFCKVCGYKKCAERDVRCTEYKEFERLIKE